MKLFSNVLISITLILVLFFIVLQLSYIIEKESDKLPGLTEVRK